jgi:GNAT superfamily N-acetyltransferase
LEDFCIDPLFQGKGYGYESLVRMEKFYPKCKHWILSTPAYSTKNHYLYEKFGYKKTEEKCEGLIYVYEKIIKE